ncbi:MAG TPA: hypothetical protein VIK86_09925 [Candidatus Paceibacterota bacterium]
MKKYLVLITLFFAISVFCSNVEAKNQHSTVSMSMSKTHKKTQKTLKKRKASYMKQQKKQRCPHYREDRRRIKKNHKKNR